MDGNSVVTIEDLTNSQIEDVLRDALPTFLTRNTVN